MLLINWQTLVVVHSNIFQHPRYQPANPERVLRLLDRILLFESILYVLIKSRLRYGLDHLQKFLAPFLNPFASSKQNIDLDYLFMLALPTIGPKIRVKNQSQNFLKAF